MKHALSTRHVLRYAGAFAAFMIGSGFASGQEILQFFSAYGVQGSGGILIAFLLFAWSGSLLMADGYRLQIPSEKSPFHYYCGGFLGCCFDLFLPILLFGMLVIMAAGAGAIFEQYYGLPHFAGSMLMMALSAACVILGLQRLVDLLSCLGPMTILFTVIIASTALSAGPVLSAGSSGAAADLLPKASLNWWFSGILYVGYNSISAVPFFHALGRTAPSKKEAILGAVLGSGFLMGACLLLHMALLKHLQHAALMDIPLLYLASLFSPVLGTLFSMIMFEEIFTTAAPMLWLLSGNLAVEGTKRHILVTVLFAAAAFLGGLLPFSTLIRYIYPCSGYMGVLLLCAMAVTAVLRKQKKA